MNRNQRALLAEQTLKILQQGYYTNVDGDVVNIREAVAQSVDESVT